MSVQALPGFREFYPDDTALRNLIFKAWRSVAAQYGFEEYDGPPLEPLELYTTKSGSEIVDQLYHFKDKGGRDVALRPEMTPTLARMVGAHAQRLKKPIRWFSIPQLFRYERPQRGRLREHFQLNMDIVGEDSPLADAEIVAATIDIMRWFHLDSDDVRVRISHRGAVTRALRAHVGVSDESELLGLLTAVDRFERDPEGSVAKVEKVLGHDKIRVRRAVEFLEYLAGPAVGVANLVDRYIGVSDEGNVTVSPKLRIDECLEHLDAMGLGKYVEVDFRIVRGLAYYTGMVFELFDRKRGLRAICGGGRYDGLLKALGGADLPAVGFGMGDVVLAELLKSRDTLENVTPRLDAFVVAVTGLQIPRVLRLAHVLRDQGCKIEFALKELAVAKQFKIAASRNAKWAIVVGPDEKNDFVVTVRDMDGGSENQVKAWVFDGDIANPELVRRLTSRPVVNP